MRPTSRGNNSPRNNSPRNIRNSPEKNHKLTEAEAALLQAELDISAVMANIGTNKKEDPISTPNTDNNHASKILSERQHSRNEVTPPQSPW